MARESARSLLIAERNQEHHESRLCEVTWKEVDNILAKNKLEQFSQDNQEIAELGIELHD